MCSYSSFFYISDSDDNKTFTICHALEELEEDKDQLGYEYFHSRCWLDWTESDMNNHKWTAPHVYGHLFLLYRQKMFWIQVKKGDQGAL